MMIAAEISGRIIQHSRDSDSSWDYNYDEN